MGIRSRSSIARRAHLQYRFCKAPSRPCCAKRPGLMVASMAAPAVASLTLNVLLIPRFGLDGAMWASTTAFATGAVASWFLARRVLPLPLPCAPAPAIGSARLRSQGGRQ